MGEELKQFQKRKTRVEGMIVLGVLTLMASALLYVFDGPLVLVVGTVIVGTITVFFAFSGFISLQDDFIDNVLKDILEESVDQGFYDPKQGLSESQVYQSEQLATADYFKSDDFLSGSLEGVSFVSSNVILMHRETVSTDKGTTKNLETYFNGRIFSFEFNKTFNGALQILSEKEPVSQRPYKPIHLDNNTFNDTFKTFTTNKKTTLDILSTHVMKALLKIENNHPGKIAFSFLDSKFYVTINNTQGTFKLKVFTPLDVKGLEAFNEDLKILTDVVKTLKKKKKVFEKETFDFTESH